MPVLGTQKEYPENNLDRENHRISLISLFRSEVEKQLSVLSNELQALLCENPSQDQVDKILCAAHSLKGAARLVEINSVVRISHAIEERILQIFHGHPLTESSLDKFLEAFSLIAEISNHHEEHILLWESAHEPSVQQIVANLMKDINKQRNPNTLLRKKDSFKTKQARMLETTSTRQANPLKDDRVLGLATDALLSNYRQSQILDSLWHFKQEHQRLVKEVEMLIELQVGSGGVDLLKLLQLKENSLLLRDEFKHRFVELQDSERQNNHIVSNLHRELLSDRMQPFSEFTQHLSKLTHNLGQKLHKDVQLLIEGKSVLIDRNLFQEIELVLLHLIQNAVDHGLETNEDRIKANKVEKGNITICARAEGGSLYLEVSDDGKGIDIVNLRDTISATSLLRDEVLDMADYSTLLSMIFLPGVSINESASDISGRGMGLNLVQKAVQSIGGTLSVKSNLGIGSSFEVRLPLSLSRKNIQFFRAGYFVYGVAQETLSIPEVTADSLIRTEYGQAILYEGETIPLAYAGEALNVANVNALDRHEDFSFVVVTDGQERYALIVDEILDDQYVIVQRITTEHKANYILGSALRHDYGTSMILDEALLIQHVKHLQKQNRISHVPLRVGDASNSAVINALVVDDSKMIRELQKRILQNCGYRVDEVGDCEQAMSLCEKNQYQLVVTDVDMPNKDGYQLFKGLRKMEGYADVPVLFLTSRHQEEVQSHIHWDDQLEYLNKNYFTSLQFVRVVDRMKNKYVQTS